MTTNGTDDATRRAHPERGTPVPTRRQFLATATAATSVGLAGCSGGGTDGTDADGDGGDGGDSPDGEASPGPDVTSPPSADCEGIEVSENVTTDTTWSADDCPLVVLKFNIGVTDGATLTIEPGVQVVGVNNTSLTVESDGTLRADGEPSNPVWFYGSSDDPDHWRGLIVKSDGDNRVDNAVVRHAGFNNNVAVNVEGGARFSMTNTLVADCAGHGMVVGGTLDSFEYNAFRNNGRNPIVLPTNQLDALDAGSTYAGGNGYDAVFVSNGTVENEATWAPTDAPYYFNSGRHTLEAPVTVQSGTHFTFGEDSQLLVGSGGSLTADGTDEAPVVFEGDPAEPGTWRGITLAGDATATLDNVELAHGGRAAPDANLRLGDQSSATVTNSLIRACSAYGIYVGSNATLDQSNNTFRNNEEGDLGGPGV
jgi:hypothetical protein